MGRKRVKVEDKKEDRMVLRSVSQKMGRKRVKVEDEKEDRISDLPDPIIQHILSFLPSTDECIRTGILSKRWKNQWTQVPVLIFNFPTSGMCFDNFLEFLDHTLIQHDCSKIKKFHLENYNYSLYRTAMDPELTSTIRFATEKHVEDLSFSLLQLSPYMLPEFLLNNASLVKLRISGCTFPPNGKVNWLCLTTLSFRDCTLNDQVIAHVLLSGSPLLESLEFARCAGFREIVITSKFLKRFVLEGSSLCYINALQISCPKLEELSLKEIFTNVKRLIPRAIKHILSVSLLLKSIDLYNCRSIVNQFVIASKSLERLALGQHINNSDVFKIEISCPNLEELKMFDYLKVTTAKLLDLPSSLCAIIDFDHIGLHLQTTKSLIMEILEQLHHINELKIGSDQFMEVLSTVKTRPLFSLVLNIKCLTLNSPVIQKHNSGIARLLRISPKLEKLVINLPSFYRQGSNKIRKNYWVSNATVFDCLVAHLKIIRIVDFGFTKRDLKCQHLLNFVQFLLKNAQVLEKMVVVVKDDGKKGSPLQVSQELLSFPICSQNAIIEVLNSNTS